MSNASLSPVGAPRTRTPWLAVSVLVGAVIVFAGGAWLFYAKRAPTQTNTPSTSQRREFVSNTIGIRLQLAPGWSAVGNSPFPGDHVFQSATAKDCGCVLYVTRETNPGALSPSDWLSSDSTKRDTYMTRAEFERRSTSPDATTRQFAGTYEEAATTLAGVTGLQQTYENEGGGYVRSVLSVGHYIYAITAWSDGYYFSDKAKQTQYDGGRLKAEVDAMLSSLVLP